MGGDILRSKSMGDRRPQTDFEVQKAVLTDPYQPGVERLQSHDITNARTTHIVIRAVLVQLRIDLLWWQELSEDIPVRAGAKVANTSEESKRGRSIRNRKTTVFKLLK